MLSLWSTHVSALPNYEAMGKARSYKKEQNTEMSCECTGKRTGVEVGNATQTCVAARSRCRNLLFPLLVVTDDARLSSCVRAPSSRTAGLGFGASTNV